MPLDIFKTIKAATKAVPFVKYALGLAGIAGVIALVKSYQIDLQVGLWGTVVILCLMLILFLLAKMSQNEASFFRKPAASLLWAVVVLFIATALLLLTSSFFSWPQDLHYIVAPDKKIDYTLYLQHENTTTAVNLKNGQLCIRAEGKDYPADNTEIGTYRFLAVDKSLLEDSTRLLLKNETKYTFDNGSKQKVFHLTGNTVEIVLLLDTNYLKIKGNIYLHGQPLENAKVSIRNTSLFTFTNADGYYEMRAPKESNDDILDISVSAKEAPVKQYQAVLGKANDFDIAN